VRSRAFLGPEGPQRTLRIVKPRVWRTDLVHTAMAADSFACFVFGDPRRNLIALRTFLTQ
jgi:hypothetical protein